MTLQVFRRRVSALNPVDKGIEGGNGLGSGASSSEQEARGLVDTDSEGGRGLWVWVLDVDGVINVSSPHPSWGTHRGSAVVKDETGYGYSFRWAWGLVEAIVKVAESRKVTMAWGTTWIIGNRVSELEKLWGLPRLARLWKPGAEVQQEDVGLAKVAQVCRLAIGGSRVIWTDDRDVPLAGPFRNDLLDKGALLISPDPDKGLARNDLEMIRSVIGMERWDD